MNVYQKYLLAIIAVLSLSLLPSCVHAAILINEVQLLPTGSRFIELYNTGGADVDLTGWYLQRKTASGSSFGSLVSSANFQGKIIRADGYFLISRVVLSNSDLVVGDLTLTDSNTIQLKSGNGDVVDSVAWGSVASGESYQKTSAGDWIVGTPTPEAINGGESGTASAADVATDTSTSNVDTSQSQPQTQTQMTGAGGQPAPLMEVDLGGDRTVESGAGSFFEGKLYNKDGVPLSNVRYLWNFGNGETHEGQSVFFAYQYPGAYNVVLTADAGNGYSAEGSIKIEAVAAEVSVSQGSDGSIAVTNTTHANKKLDVGMWTLRRGDASFVIPRGTIILPGTAVRFAPSLLKLPQSESAQLLYPDGMVAASTDPMSDPKTSGISYEAAPQNKQPAVSAPQARGTTAPAAAGAVDEMPSTSSPQSLSSSSSQSASASTAAGESGVSPFVLSVFGLSALTVIGAAGALYARPRNSLTDGDEEKDEDDDRGEEGGNGSPYAKADALAAKFTIQAVDEL